MNTKYIFSVVLVIISFSAMAQGGPPATPIDGGLGILLAGGAAYGIRKIVKIQKRN